MSWIYELEMSYTDKPTVPSYNFQLRSTYSNEKIGKTFPFALFFLKLFRRLLFSAHCFPRFHSAVELGRKEGHSALTSDAHSFAWDSPIHHLKKKPQVI